MGRYNTAVVAAGGSAGGGGRAFCQNCRPFLLLLGVVRQCRSII